MKSRIFQINPIKTLYFNFKYFKWSTAIKLPVIIYRNTYFHRLEGKVKIDSDHLHFGMIRIGLHNIGTRDVRFQRTILDIYGDLTLSDKVMIGRGSKLSVGGTLSLGDGFSITGDSSIICMNRIDFGKNCLLSWDVQIMDTDFHSILDKDGNLTNPDQPIKIGNHVWIGSKVVMLKGVEIADNCIIGANATITKSVHEPNCIIGNFGRILKTDIHWELSGPKDWIKNHPGR